jgi:hypothetical protein
MTTPHEADLINADRRAQADMMRDRLERMGVIVTIAHYTGDSSYPTEYTVTYGNIQAVGPTFDLALFEFVEKLLAYATKADSIRAEGESSLVPSFFDTLVDPSLLQIL